MRGLEDEGRYVGEGAKRTLSTDLKEETKIVVAVVGGGRVDKVSLNGTSGGIAASAASKIASAGTESEESAVGRKECVRCFPDSPQERRSRRTEGRAGVCELRTKARRTREL